MTHLADAWPAGVPDRVRSRAATIMRLIGVLRHRGEPRADVDLAGHLACSVASIAAVRRQAAEYGAYPSGNEKAGGPLTGPPASD